MLCFFDATPFSDVSFAIWIVQVLAVGVFVCLWCVLYSLYNVFVFVARQLCRPNSACWDSRWPRTLGICFKVFLTLKRHGVSRGCVFVAVGVVFVVVVCSLLPCLRSPHFGLL